MSPVFGHGRLRLYLLKLLAEQPRHGYEIIRLLEDHFGGMYAPSAGTIYPRLARLEAEGLVTHSRERGRKVYQITEAGHAELDRRQDELAAIEDELDDSAASLTDLAREIHEGVRDTVQGLKYELNMAKAEIKRDLQQGIRQDLPQAALDIAAKRFGAARPRPGHRPRPADRSHPAQEHPGYEHPDPAGPHAAPHHATNRHVGDPDDATPFGPRPRGDERFPRLLAEFAKQARRLAAGSEPSGPTAAQLGECVAILDEALDRLRVTFDRRP
jgi:DNA-binding PadR family transcriptional regulator